MPTPRGFFRRREGCQQHHVEIRMAQPGPENPNYEKDQIAKLKSELSAIARTISDYQPVILLVHSEDLPEADTTFQSCGIYGVEIRSIDLN